MLYNVIGLSVHFRSLALREIRSSPSENLEDF